MRPAFSRALSISPSSLAENLPQSVSSSSTSASSLHFLVYVLYPNVGYSAKCWSVIERERKREQLIHRAKSMCSTVILLTDCCSECASASADAVSAAAGAAVPAHSALQLLLLLCRFIFRLFFFSI